MPHLRVPALMKYYVSDQSEVPLKGATVAELLENLVAEYPLIRSHILDKNGDLRRFVNIFVNDLNIKDLRGLKTVIQESDRIILLPSISGGS